MAINQVALTSGIVISYAIDYAFAGSQAWRWMFGLAVIPAAAFGVGLTFIRDCPRWLVASGHADQARAVLKRIRGPEQVEGELGEIQRSVAWQKGTWSELLGPQGTGKAWGAITLPCTDEGLGRLARDVGLDPSTLPGGGRIGRMASADQERHHDHILRRRDRWTDRGHTGRQGPGRGPLRDVRSRLDGDACSFRVARTGSANVAGGKSSQGERGQEDGSETDGAEGARARPGREALGRPDPAPEGIGTPAALFLPIP